VRGVLVQSAINWEGQDAREVRLFHTLVLLRRFGQDFPSLFCPFLIFQTFWKTAFCGAVALLGMRFL
jgi:hypothetical protein